ncbi:MAG: BON domain-containing protein [Planctomycetota bacterium]
MRTHWLILTVLMLVMPGLRPDAQAQPRPRPGTSKDEFRSRFGPRSLGFPVSPRPRVSADYGVFGPRPNFGQGFSTPRSYSLWDDFPPEAAPRFSADSLLGQPTGPPAQAAGELRQAIEQPSELVQSAGQDAGQAEPAVEQGEPSRETAPQPGAPLAATAQPSQPGSPPQTLADGIATPAPGRSARPNYQWSTDAIRTLPAESILPDRQRAEFRNRLRSPLEVTIRQETAILRGVVASPRDRLLAGHLARFEPGVREVKNELTVAASPPEN